MLDATGADGELFEVAKKLEEVAIHDEYFVERKLYANVDFYSGLIYHAIGFPKNMFTNCFAIGRLPGWIAQWQEMIRDPETKIGRPRQVYTGPTARIVRSHRRPLSRCRRALPRCGERHAARVAFVTDAADGARPTMPRT